MKFVHSADLRKAERTHLESLGDGAEAVPAMWVREVGGGVAEVVATVLDEVGPRRSAVVVAGPGMNGSDGLAAALSLHRAGYRCEVWSVAGTGEPSGLRAKLAEACRQAGMAVEEVVAGDGRLARRGGFRPGVLVDALFGTGFHGEPEGAAARSPAIGRFDGVRDVRQQGSHQRLLW